jgi:hypothetical protein
LEGDSKVNQNNWRGMGHYYFDRRALEAPEPFPAAPVAIEPAQVAYEHVLKDAGATLPKRDSVDERIIHETREGTGHIINWIKEVGGADFPSAAVPLQKE